MGPSAITCLRAGQIAESGSADERSGNTCHDHGVEITCVTVDCRDPPRLAAFWSEALDWKVAYVAGDGA
jgi:hypothetical protein